MIICLLLSSNERESSLRTLLLARHALDKANVLLLRKTTSSGSGTRTKVVIDGIHTVIYRRAEGVTDRRGQLISLNPIRQLGISKQLSERNSEYIGIYLPVLTLK